MFRAEASRDSKWRPCYSANTFGDGWASSWLLGDLRKDRSLDLLRTFKSRTCRLFRRLAGGEKPQALILVPGAVAVCSALFPVFAENFRSHPVMPVFSVSDLQTLAARVLESAGTPAGDAEIVSRELSEANAVGHDSHGVMRLMQYVQMIDDGFVRLGAKVETVRSGGAFTILDANFNFGQVAASLAVERGVELARNAGTATVMIRNCNHVVKS